MTVIGTIRRIETTNLIKGYSSALVKRLPPMFASYRNSFTQNL